MSTAYNQSIDGSLVITGNLTVQGGTNGTMGSATYHTLPMNNNGSPVTFVQNTDSLFAFDKVSLLTTKATGLYKCTVTSFAQGDNAANDRTFSANVYVNGSVNPSWGTSTTVAAHTAAGPVYSSTITHLAALTAGDTMKFGVAHDGTDSDLVGVGAIYSFDRLL